MNLKNKEITYVHDSGLFSSLGEAWVAVLRTITSREPPWPIPQRRSQSARYFKSRGRCLGLV